MVCKFALIACAICAGSAQHLPNRDVRSRTEHNDVENKLTTLLLSMNEPVRRWNAVGNSINKVRVAASPMLQDRIVSGRVAHDVERRAWLARIGTIGAALLSSEPAFADGAWAKRDFDATFSEDDFKDFTTTESGLQYKIFAEGKENGAKPLKGQTIKAHYAGYLFSNGGKFDSSYDRRSPLEFAVGQGRVIKGWDEALLDMKVGEKRILKIPPSLGYGSRGAGGVIPPDATLVFYVELVSKDNTGYWKE